jgi:hypothetical protein
MDAMFDRMPDATTPKTDEVAEKIIDGKRYIVKSVFVGEQDVKTALLRLAERKAVREMGLDRIVT